MFIYLPLGTIKIVRLSNMAPWVSAALFLLVMSDVQVDTELMQDTKTESEPMTMSIPENGLDQG